MRKTQHLLKRMSQRGITNEMLQLVKTFGKYEQDKLSLDKKDAKKLLREMNQMQKTLEKLLACEPQEVELRLQEKT